MIPLMKRDCYLGLPRFESQTTGPHTINLPTPQDPKAALFVEYDGHPGHASVKLRFIFFETWALWAASIVIRIL